MTQGDISTLILMAVLVIMSAYFSATETAFSTVNTTRLKTLADKGDKKAARVLALSENYDKLLSTILVGNNIVNITLSSVATIFFIRLLDGDSNTGATVATAAVTLVVLIFGEISPKSLAKESPESFAMFSAPMLRALIWVLTPVNFIFSLWKLLLSKVFKIKGDRSVTSDEIITFIDSVEEGGDLDEDESELLRSAVEFSDQEAADILTPRVDIVGVEEDCSKEEIAQVFTNTGYSRLPVYRDSLDNIVGIVHQKDFYDGPRVTEKPLSEIMKAPVYVTPGMKIHDILKLLQKEKSHVSVVTDEFGGTRGIVTMEDILEELVGEIWDETDEIEREFICVGDDVYEAIGEMRIYDFFDEFDIDVEDDDDFGDDNTTVGGWVTSMLDGEVEEGDVFRYENLVITVLEADDKRVERVQVEEFERENDEEDEL